MYETRNDCIKVINNPLVSHHGPLEEFRCIILPFGKNKYYVCARCAGAWIGTLFSLLFWVMSPPCIIVLLMLPLPAFIDWTFYLNNLFRGNNGIRFVTGFLLGCGYTAYLVAPFTGTPFLSWLVCILFFFVWYFTIILIRRLCIWYRFGF